MSQNTANVAVLLLQCGIPVLLLALGFFVGGMRERGHLKKLALREQQLADIAVTDLKSFPGGVGDGQHPAMVMGSAVIATDYFKNVLAGFRRIFGGEVKAYLSLMQRARREALIRAKIEARRKGHNAICNIRYETADIGGMSSSGKASAMVEVLAYGTSYKIPGR